MDKNEGDAFIITNYHVVYDASSNTENGISDDISVYCYGTDTERVQRALIGITVNATDSKAVYDTETGRISIQETVSVYEVSKGSLADGVLQKGDVLLSATVNGEKTEITRQYHAIE